VFRGARYAVLALSLCLCACSEITVENEVYGRYEMRTPDAKTFLDVRADHSYSETIHYTGGSEQKVSGAWQWRDAAMYGYVRVCFGSFMLPKQWEFMKDYVDDDRWEHRPNAIGGAYQFNEECTGPVREYGRTILEIDTDSSDRFVRVSALAR
jgi:hypothetical protein